MPKNVARHDDRFEKAVGFLKKYPNMKLPDAMKLADFNPVEQRTVPSTWSFIAYERKWGAAT